jgi:hypothetical protein
MLNSMAATVESRRGRRARIGGCVSESADRVTRVFVTVPWASICSTSAPTVTLGMTISGDPADSLFTVANFPKEAPTTDRTNARALYSVLTGRSAIARNARIQPDGTTYKIRAPATGMGRSRSGARS